MIKKISMRDGIGDILANGSDAVGKHFNISQDEIATVYGMEIPYHDLRRMFGMAAGYALGTPRGPCHTSCDAYFILLGVPFDEFGIDNSTVDWYQDDAAMAEYCARIQNYRGITSSLIMCIFANAPPSMVVSMLNAATGQSYDMEELKLIGERIYMMKRLFNLKMGLTAKDDHLPKIVLKPLKEGGSANQTPDFEKLKKGYYEFRTFDLV